MIEISNAGSHIFPEDLLLLVHKPNTYREEIRLSGLLQNLNFLAFKLTT